MALDQAQRNALEDHLATLQSGNPNKIESALAAIQQFGNDAVPFMDLKLDYTDEPAVVAVVAQALHAIGTPIATEVLVEALAMLGEYELVLPIWEQLNAMGQLPDKWQWDYLSREAWEQSYMSDNDKSKKKKTHERSAAQPPRVADYLIRTRLLPDLHGDDPQKCQAALDELLRISVKASPALTHSLENDDRSTWKHTLLVLKQVGDEQALTVLQQHAEDDDPLIQTLVGGAIRAIERRLEQGKQAQPDKRNPVIKPKPQFKYTKPKLSAESQKPTSTPDYTSRYPDLF